MNRAGELAAVVLLVCGVHAGCGGGSNGGREDPYANLMDVAEGEVKCVADECCFGSCGGSGDTVCVTRSADLIVQSLDADGAVPDCPELIFPEWFYNHDCFVGTGGIVGPGHPSKAGEPLQRHIYDYVVTDSKIERKFVTELDTSEEVVLYVKLPRGFSIPTPVGDYNPDWAIAFKEGAVKHVYFVAETKGDMSTMQLREIEDVRIKCARKFFVEINRTV